MGDGAVVLPKAVDEVVGKRRDRRDRLPAETSTVGHAAGGNRQREGSPSSPKQRVRTRQAQARRALRPRAPGRPRCRRKADRSSSSIGPVSRSVGCRNRNALGG